MEAQANNVVNWFEIYVEDIDRAKKFYQSVLTKELMDMDSPDGLDGVKMAAFPWVQNAPNAAGALIQTKDIEAGGNSILVYFTCQDCKIEESRVEDAGGKVLKPKFSIGDFGFCSICMDTEGNTFGLYSLE